MLSGFHWGRAEPDCQHERAAGGDEIYFAGERDVAVLGTIVRPAQTFVCLQLLPSIRNAHEARGPGQPRRVEARASAWSRSANSMGVPL